MLKIPHLYLMFCVKCLTAKDGLALPVLHLQKMVAQRALVVEQVREELLLGQPCSCAWAARKVLRRNVVWSFPYGASSYSSQHWRVSFEQR